MNALDEISLLRACVNGDRDSQKMLYKRYYGFAMSICMRYAGGREEAQEIVNDGFLKIFAALGKIDLEQPMKPWIRRIMVNASIDHFRRNAKHQNQLDIAYAAEQPIDETAISQLTTEEIMAFVQQLSPAYRTVFNLYVIEGYTHNEIANMLGVSEGASKSNLAKARVKLRKMLENAYPAYKQNYG